MKRVIILVEGDSEIILMNELVIPFLYQVLYTCGKAEVECSIEVAKITTNKTLNKKGGNISYVHLVNEINRFVSQGCTLITTFFDFFRLPTDFPGYTKAGNRVDEIEKAVALDMKSRIPALPEFLPYIQMHEFEALLFSGIEGFELVLDEESQLKKIQEIMDEYDNPEDINGGTNTAPSKRLTQIYNYDKTADSELILEMLGLDVIYSKCPRFSNWLDELGNKLTDLSYI